MRRTGALVVMLTLAVGVSAPASAADPASIRRAVGYLRCPKARAWNGFFKWASARHTSCRRARAYVRAYAKKAQRGPMPRRLGNFRCTIRYWRNEEGDVYASRHRCTRGDAVIRFYGMV